VSNPVYEDFTLLVERNEDGRSYQARVIESSGGEGRASFGRDELFDEENTAVAPPVVDADARHLSVVPLDATPGLQRLESAKAYGARLFKALFKESVRDRFVETRKSAQTAGAIMRIRLNLTSVPELARLPWEYLYNPELNVFYARDRRPVTVVVRYLDQGEPVEDLMVDEPLRVLVMVSKPSDYADLKVGVEWAQLQEALGELVKNGQVVMDQLTVATLQALVEQLKKAKSDGQPYHVFHFIGHGVFDPKTSEGRILLQDENGQGRQVSAEKLGNRLREFDLRLAVINACEGARISGADSYTGMAPELSRTALIPAVIAMQFEISDRAAIVFAHSFYKAIAEYQSVDAALTQARLDVYSDEDLDENHVEWATPVLYTRTRDGRIVKPRARKDTAPLVAAVAEAKVDPARTSHPLDGHFQTLMRALLQGQLVPFLGFDVNLYGRKAEASWEPGSVLPGNRELAGFLAKRFHYPDQGLPDLMRVAQYAMINKDYGEAELYDALAEAFSGDHSPSPVQLLFAEIPKLMAEGGYPRKKDDPTRQRFMIVTTNLDDLIERAFRAALPAFHVVSYGARSGEQGKFSHFKFAKGATGALSTRSAVIEDGADYRGFSDAHDVDPIILKLPGSLDLMGERKFNFAITEDHYFDYLTRKDISTMLPAELMNKLRWSSHLYLGCTLREWNLRALLFRIWGESGPRRKSWAVVQDSAPGQQQNLEQQFWEACRVERIASELEDYLTEFAARLYDLPSVGETV
jgi:hypothetical protein